MNMSFPSRRHVASLLLSILSPWRSLSPSEEVILSLFDVISLSPFDINFQEGFFWIFFTIGFGPWGTKQSSKAKVMLVEDKNHLVELEQTEIRNKWQVGFPVMKSVTPSCVLRLHRNNSVGLKTTNRCDRVHHRENTCHLSSLDK